MHNVIIYATIFYKESHMKKLYFILSLALILSFALCSCAKDTTQAQDTQTDRLDKIAALESQIAELKSTYALSAAENDKRFEELTKLLDSMQETTQGDESSETQAPTEIFQYTLEDGAATLTGYSGTEEHLVIPASIDGYRVLKIADSAFADTQIKSVVISDGIEQIGWFAFDGCTRLTSITVPASVKRIGYCALGTSESSLTIYCHQNSFALEYAKSYALTYAII